MHVTQPAVSMGMGSVATNAMSVPITAMPISSTGYSFDDTLLVPPGSSGARPCALQGSERRKPACVGTVAPNMVNFRMFLTRAPVLLPC